MYEVFTFFVLVIVTAWYPEKSRFLVQSSPLIAKFNEVIREWLREPILKRMLKNYYQNGETVRNNRRHMT
jgi:hypothetical protein